MVCDKLRVLDALAVTVSVGKSERLAVMSAVPLPFVGETTILFVAEKVRVGVGGGVMV